MSSAPGCPSCNQPIDILCFKIYEDYKYNLDTGGYSETEAEGDVMCTNCNLTLNGIGIGFDDGPVNFNREEYDKNIERVKSWYQ